MQAVVDRYEISRQIAAGGMAAVHLGRVRGAVGFARAVAIKRLHQTIANDPKFVAMFIDEARLASRIRHPNVVPTIDVVSTDGELLLVMEYVHGESLSTIRRELESRRSAMPLPIVVAIVSDVLQGLHAAHETTDDTGKSLEIVHRDVSPHNVIVGADGTSRLLDFGVAKAADRIQTTGEGQVKGKFAYMAPEQFSGRVDRRTDVYAAGIVLWELLVGRKLFAGQTPPEILARALAREIPQPRALVPEISGEVEDVVLQALETDPSRRFPTARAMNEALLAASPRASAHEVAEWLSATIPDLLAKKAELLANLERADAASAPSTPNVRPVKRRSKALALGALAGIAAALVGAVIATSSFVSHARAQPAVAAAADSAPPAPSASAPAEAPTQNLGEIPPTVITEIAASAAPVTHARHVTAPLSKPATKNDCNPPYTIDAQGIHHFKEKCL